jgi:cysteine desulfurase
MLWDLNKNGVAASTGSAWSSEDLQANQTFKAMSIAADLAHTGIRFSLSRYTTEAEIDQTIFVIQNSVARLRTISSSFY